MMLLGAFIWPGLFVAGALCATIPIIIHWLTRRRYRRIRWAAIEFLLDAQRRNQRRLHMEELILLGLRCLTLLGVAMIVARFFIQPAGQGGGPGRIARVEHIVLIDDSMSMGYELDERQRVFDTAKTAAIRILDQALAGHGDDVVTLFRMTRAQEPLVAGVVCSEEGLSGVRSRITALQLTQASFSTADVFENVRDYLDAHPDILSVVLYIISDFQARDWLEGGWPDDRETSSDAREAAAQTTARPSSSMSDPAAALRDWTADERRMLRVVLINVGASEPSNLSVSDVRFVGGLPVAVSPCRVEAGVANFGSAPAENIELTISAGTMSGEPQTVSRLAAGQVGRATFEVVLPSAGDEAIRIALPDDRLDADNAAYAVVNVVNAVRVLVVNGEPSGDAFVDETHLLTTALRPEGELFSGNDVTTIITDALSSTPLEPFHAVILANVSRVADEVAEALYRYALAGGGVLFFLGDQVDMEAYNRVMFTPQRRLLPAALVDIAYADDQPRRLVIRDPLHPAWSALAREGDPLGLGLVRFRRYVACEAPPAGAPESGVGAARIEKDDNPENIQDGHSPEREPTVTAHGPRTTVPVTFDDAARTPAILECRVGAGKAVMIVTSADKEWNSWADSPTYVPVMLELVSYVARRHEVRSSGVVGERLSLTVDGDEFEPHAFVRTPNYPTESEIAISGVPSADGRSLLFSFDAPRTAGIHAFVLQTRQGQEVTRWMAVNVDDRESDLTAVREEELRKVFRGWPVEFITGLEPIERLVSEGRREWWPVLTVLVVVMLMTEQFLAWHFGRRGREVKAEGRRTGGAK